MNRVDVHTTPLGHAVIGCAIEVHATLGPGLLESVYERSAAHEFRLKELGFREQVAMPVLYKGVDVGLGFRADFVFGDELVVEFKTVEKVLPIHYSQLLTYMRLLGIRQGFLFNFNVRKLMDGFKSLLL
jgi:GxxExxY protein